MVRSPEMRGIFSLLPCPVRYTYDERVTHSRTHQLDPPGQFDEELTSVVSHATFNTPETTYSQDEDHHRHDFRPYRGSVQHIV